MALATSADAERVQRERVCAPLGAEEHTSAVSLGDSAIRRFASVRGVSVRHKLRQSPGEVAIPANCTNPQMKLTLPRDLLASLLQPSARPSQTVAISAQARSESLRRAAIEALAHWGHLRCTELARVLWPEAKYPEQLCQRLMRKLMTAGLVLARSNAVGTRSFVLTRPGAALAEALGVKARHGLDLASVSGATFIHRSIANRYGIERQLQGATSYGEYAMALAATPINRDLLNRQFGKLPDLMIIQDGLDWVEVESSAKSKSELQRCLAIAKHCGGMFTGPNVTLNRVIFVCDNRLNHEQRIRKAALELWANLTERERAKLSARVSLVQVVLGPCSKWLSMTEPTPLKL